MVTEEEDMTLVSVSTAAEESNVHHARLDLKHDWDRIQRLDSFLEFLEYRVEPLLPEGVTLPRNMYSYSAWHDGGGSVEIEIPYVEGREWRGLNGTAGLIYGIRKALNIERLSRSTYTYGERVQNTYFGIARVDGRSFNVNIRMGEQLQPTCHIEYVEEERTEIKRIAKVVCN